MPIQEISQKEVQAVAGALSAHKLNPATVKPRYLSWKSLTANHSNRKMPAHGLEKLNLHHLEPHHSSSRTSSRS